MDTMSAKLYLQECDHDIIDAAVSGGDMDAGCYYAYLLEVSAVLPGDKSLRDEYDRKREASHTLAMLMYKGDAEGVQWLNSCIYRFERQWDVFEQLAKKIKDYSFSDVLPLKRAQLNFMITQLQQQKRYFKTVLFFSPSRHLLSPDESMKKHAEAMQRRDKVEKMVFELKATIEK